MKKILLVIAMALLSLLSIAQDDNKITVALEPVIMPQGDFGDYPQQIFTMLSNDFTKAKRFVVMPTNDWNVPQDANGDPYIDIAKSYGVSYMVIATVNSFFTSNYTVTNPNGTTSPGFGAHISLSLKIMNVETGSVFNSKTFEVTPFLHMVTPEAAISQAAGNLNGNLKKWIGEIFPITIPLVKILDENAKKGAVKILIQAGSDSGISNSKSRKAKTQFKIVEFDSEMVDGKSMSRTVQVGTAEVAMIEDTNFTDCIVTSGGLDVSQKLKDGKKLFLITIN